MSEIIGKVLEAVCEVSYKAASKNEEITNNAMEAGRERIGAEGVGAVIWSFILGLPICAIVIVIYVIGPKIADVLRQCSGC